MNTEIERPSAVIYQFPIRRRVRADQRSQLDAMPACEVAVIDGWYHADAIREAEPTRHS
ncbi:DUF2735 domain-containing protein [Aureimonas sp. Leaf454]|uniref:DUF2735 domain-containing protein n=1 Tax=Aureimonas sp. Leaf454 TaxID=1736381 RepID=UPI0009E7B582|nr:DUF2735 domain-containing protein [Aureimonas sp. Leaf454]